MMKPIHDDDENDSEGAERPSSKPEADTEVEATPSADLDAMAVYLRELTGRPALTRDEERSLSAEIARAKEELAKHVRALLLKAADVLAVDDTAAPAKTKKTMRARASRIRAEILGDISERRLSALAARIDGLAGMARESAALLSGAAARSASGREAIARAKKLQADILHGFGLTAADLMTAWQAIADARLALTRARQRLFESNLRLVVTIARRFHYGAIEIGDLVQEGNVALMRAVEAFDPLRNVPFASFAGPVIRRAMAEFVRATGKPVRVPKQVDDLRRNVTLARQHLSRQFGRPARPEELAAYLELPLLKVIEAMASNERGVSFDGSPADDDATLAESLADPRTVDPTEQLAADRHGAALDEMLNGLTGRDQVVLSMRYGEDASAEVTLEDVGRELGVTRERARQLEARALRGLRLRTMLCGRRKRGPAE